MYLKEVNAICSSNPKRKNKESLTFNPIEKNISCTSISKQVSGESQKLDSARIYKVDRVIETGHESYSRHHEELFTKQNVKNLNIFIVGNDKDLKNKCIFSESKYCSIVKELIKNIRQHSKRIYLSF